ncbi:SWI SNF, matrix associated, actin dependent regulator of chromatin, subfamily b, member 1 [Cichlidogyrus casuarinus]|uniref:SWI SNF, matrix associated, actin dependent regulator of chromatin, subfamily b, member 1 n=1 Tax=Cichlidogyrus casuarinus TaxID=1844966 RepID=A0ABD2PNZ4_9PLAT
MEDSYRFGEKPIEIQFDHSDEVYFLASDVGRYLRLFRGALFKKYPNLWKRVPTNEERDKLITLGLASPITAHSLLLLKASEVQQILDISIQSKLLEAKVPTALTLSSNGMLCPSLEGSGVLTGSTTSAVGQGAQASGGKKETVKWGGNSSSMPNTSFHLDPLPCPTAISRTRINKPNHVIGSRAYAFPFCMDETNPLVFHENSNEKEILVPIRLDIEFDAVKLRDCFTWNRNEQIISPDQFAELLCDDLDLNPTQFVPAIAQVSTSNTS